MMKNLINQKVKLVVVVLISALSISLLPSQATAARLSIDPVKETFAVGSTFDISVLLDTENQIINAISLVLSFPADKLQVVSPTVGNSIIGIYTTAPKYDNQNGKIEIVGGIHNGVNISNGLVAKISFKVKAPGLANIRIQSSSRVLLNDGQGTDALSDVRSASFSLELNSANGPVVSLDESQLYNGWFFDKVISINWLQQAGAEGFSYLLSKNPDDIPDDIVESTDGLVVYKNLKSGVFYFHIKELTENNWGATSHTLVQVDNNTPEPFSIDVWPGIVTNNQRPQFTFSAKDFHSGIDRYEIKLVNLSQTNVNEQEFFIETGEQFIPEKLEYGKYDVIVRAYDKAGNIRESSQRIVISNSPFRAIASTGLFLRDKTILPWSIVFVTSLIILTLLLWLGWLIRRRYLALLKMAHHDFMEESTKKQLLELESYRSKYGKLVAVMLLSFFIFIPVYHSQAHISNIAAPQILSSPKIINADEIFYLSGRTVEPISEVVVHIQGLQDESVFEHTVVSSNRGDWFYQSDEFLNPGKYVIWTTAKHDSQISPPGPQVELQVRSVAIQLAGTKITYENIYLVTIIFLIFCSLFLLAIIIYYFVHHKRHRLHLLDELNKVEQSIKYGFIQLRHDLAAELALIKTKTDGKLDGELALRASQLQEDIGNVEKLVGDEIGQVRTDS